MLRKLITNTLLSAAFFAPLHAFGQVVEWRNTSVDNNTWQLMQSIDQFDNGTKRHDLTALDLVDKLIDTQPRAALQYLNQASNLKPVITSTFDYFKFKIFYKIGDFDQAIPLGEKLGKLKLPSNWRATVIEGMIAIYNMRNQPEKMVQQFRQFSATFGHSKMNTATLRLIAEAFQKLGQTDQYHSLLESLAAQFPNTNDSRWAFHRLVDENCEKNSKRYIFSTWLLRNLSWNTNVNPDLKDYILALIDDQPVRVTKHRMEKLEEIDRLKTYMTMRFYDHAEALGLKILENQKKYTKKEIDQTYEMLAKNAIKMAKPKLAAEYFAHLISRNNRYSPTENYSLADAFRYLNKYRTAFELYEKTPAIYDRLDNAWQRFWMAYRDRNYEAAIKGLVGLETHFRDRDNDGKVAFLYWRAKILKQQGNKEEAINLFKEILGQAGQNYYTGLILKQHPELLGSLKNSGTDSADTEIKRTEVMIASLKTPPGVFTNDAVDNEIPIIKDLIKHGLKSSARQKIQELAEQTKLNDEIALKLHTLFNEAGDYEPKISLLSKMKVLSYDKNGGVQDLFSDQKQFNENWRVYYPIAYQELVSKYAQLFKIEPLFLLSVMRAESYYREHALSGVGAKGLVQIMPFTGIRIAKELSDYSFNPMELSDPSISIAYGAYYLNKLLDYYGNNQYVALAAYNAGPEAVNFWLESCSGCQIDEFIESIPYRETRRYVKKISKFHQMYQNIYGQPSKLSSWPKLPVNLPDASSIY